jgi:ABC-type nitrate/sulfonate/bicarbonate transport system substrate-binding protein
MPREIWFTRCPVPTATGIAYALGWFRDEFAADGIRIASIQEAPPELSRHHYDHEIPTLIREGGSLLALAAKAQHAPTKLIGLTWIDEAQAIIVRPDSNISQPLHLKGARVALPAYVRREIPAHVRGSSIARGMSLHGIKGALRSAGLSLDDITFVEVGSGQSVRGSESLGDLWSGLDELVSRKVDAVYVKGASAVEAARKRGLAVGIDLDKFPDRRTRVNNGTPRPITVHESLLETGFDLVARFLAQTLRAADWAAANLQGVYDILKRETRAGDAGVLAAYRDGFHRKLHPNLSADRVNLLHIQKTFMLVHGFLDRDFDLDAWVDPRPLAAARALLERRPVTT